MTNHAGLACNITLDFGRTGWYAEIVDELAAKVRALPVWSRFTTLRPDDGSAGPLTPERFDAIVRNVKNRSWYLDAGDDRDVEFLCFRDGPRVDLRLQLFDDDFRRHARDLEAVLAAFATGFGQALVMPASGITMKFMPDLPRDPLGNPPDSGAMKFDQIADALDRRLPVARPDSRPGRALARLLAAPPPEGVRQVEIGDVVLYFWAADPASPEELVRARNAHQRWMVERLSAAPPAPAGDRPLHATAPIQAPPLSFIDAMHKRGFRTVLVQPDGSIDEASWAVAVAAARKMLPDLEDLEAIYAVVPLRDHALALAERARNDGLAGVAYPADGDLWVPVSG
ncbi:MAG TPA: hypothetical protein VHT91_13230 [Kofleriaceae bacterium]|nr:hypothetical protein [Kofleriaceae bacterium]